MGEGRIRKFFRELIESGEAVVEAEQATEDRVRTQIQRDVRSGAISLEDAAAELHSRTPTPPPTPSDF